MPWRCSGASPRSRGPRSRSTVARSCCCAGRTGQGRRRCCGCVPACSPLSGGSGRCSGATSPVDRAAVRRRVGLLGHANGLYADLTVTENVRFWARRSVPRPERCGHGAHGPRRAARRRARRTGCPPVRSAGRRWPASSPGGPSCGCSTSRTPASTPRARRARRHAPPGRGGRGDGDGGEPRAGACRSAGDAHGRGRRRPDREDLARGLRGDPARGPLATPVRRRPWRERCGGRRRRSADEPAPSRPRICASNGAAGSSPTRSCPSPA